MAKIIVTANFQSTKEKIFVNLENFVPLPRKIFPLLPTRVGNDSFLTHPYTLNMFLGQLWFRARCFTWTYSKQSRLLTHWHKQHRQKDVNEERIDASLCLFWPSKSQRRPFVAYHHLSKRQIWLADPCRLLREYCGYSSIHWLSIIVHPQASSTDSEYFNSLILTKIYFNVFWALSLDSSKLVLTLFIFYSYKGRFIAGLIQISILENKLFTMVQLLRL